MIEVAVVGVRELPLFRSASVGDTVTILTPHGQERRGRVVFKFATHLVLNGGGKHGTPLIADDRNTVKVTRKRQR
jgi:hypothetical protein